MRNKDVPPLPLIFHRAKVRVSDQEYTLDSIHEYKNNAKTFMNIQFIDTHVR